MKVGLVRHFKVRQEFPDKILVTQDEVTQWFDEYDVADIEHGNVDLGGVEWNRCFSSDLPRALRTAETCFNGKVEVLEGLREVPVYPIFRRNRIRLPFIVWAVLVRVVWLLNHRSQLESTAAVRKRAEAVLDQILSHPEENLLVVSHAAFMIIVRKELLRRGFKGPGFDTPANGKLYVFEK